MVRPTEGERKGREGGRSEEGGRRRGEEGERCRGGELVRCQGGEEGGGEDINTYKREK